MKGNENQVADTLSRVVFEEHVKINSINIDNQFIIANHGEEDLVQKKFKNLCLKS